MAANTQHAWTVYANQLFPQGYGYPLWQPDPDPTAAREISIGDVGWMSNGGFFQLFNARMREQESQVHADVPEDFVPFDPPNLIISGPNKSETAIPPLCSQTVETFDASGLAQANTGPALVSAGGSFSFKCTDNQGAFLMFSPAAYSTEIKSKRHITNYMREHFTRWVQFSEKYGLDLKEHEILFVCGMTKTARWAVAAFQGNYKKKQGTISADLGSAGGLNMSVSISNQSLPQTHRKVGPSRPAPTNVPLLAAPDGDSSAATGSEPNDQCIFIHYYQMKRRIGWFRTFKAAAGPHELPPPGPDDAGLGVLAGGDADEDDDFEQATKPTEETYNPVNHLLDYILENSDASMAIASDLDLYALFKDQQFPADVPAALASSKPTVEVDENGVGTVAVQIDFGTRIAVEDETEVAQGTVDPPNQPAEATPQGPVADAPAGNGEGDDDDGDGKTLAKRNPGAQASVHDGSVTALAYSRNGRYAASGSEDTTVIVWNVPEERMMHKFTPHSDTVSSLAFSPDNQLLASGSNDQHVILWTVATGQEFKRLDSQVSIHSVAFSPDGTKLIAGAYDGSLWVWDTATYDAPLKISKHLAVVTFIVFSPDGRLMATGGTESTCYIWDMANLGNMQPKSVLQGHKGMVCCAAFSPDGERIVTASDDGSSRVWKCENGDALVLLHEHGGPVWSVAFSPDGKRVASGSSDSTVKVCDSYSGDRLLSLEGHESMVNVVRFSSDGKHLASAASDSTVRLWNAEDGSLLTTYNEHSDNVTTVMFSPEGSTLASGSHDGTVRIRPIIAVV
ncbi:WD40 repeat-like protein [Ganoderma leucocontextum]|nr:WD40 repeat-like protein [Ganoderma leucocontextum]